MLQLDGAAFRQGTFSLEVSLELAKGERLALLGPSGSGKSTLLSVIAGFSLLDEGRVTLAGRDHTRSAVAMRPVSMIFQDGNLFPHLTAFQNVALGLQGNLRLSEEHRARVFDALGRVDLGKKAESLPAALSGGQQSRVALARMLVMDRPVLLMDEPFAALDPALRRDMGALVGEIARERQLTLVLVTHDLRDVRDLASHIAVLDAGRIVLMGTAPDLLASPPTALLPWL